MFAGQAARSRVAGQRQERRAHGGRAVTDRQRAAGAICKSACAGRGGDQGLAVAERLHALNFQPAAEGDGVHDNVGRRIQRGHQLDNAKSRHAGWQRVRIEFCAHLARNPQRQAPR